MTEDMIILTGAQRAAVVAFNTAGVAIAPRAIDGASPGAGLVGRFVAPRAILENAEYQALAPAMIAYLSALPWASLDTGTIFAPPSGPRG